MVFRSELAARRITPRFEEQSYYHHGSDSKQTTLFDRSAHFRHPRLEKESSPLIQNNPQRRDPIRIETGNYDHIYRSKPSNGNLRYATGIERSYDDRKRVVRNPKKFKKTNF